MKRLLILLLLTLSYTVLAEEKQENTCVDKGELRYTYRSKKNTLPSSYCFNKDRTTLVSKSCQSNEACETKKVIKSYKKKSFDLFNSGVGSPGFNLCYKMEGRPQIVEFFDGKEWFKLDRCIFEKDNSYVDTGTLVKLWRQK